MVSGRDEWVVLVIGVGADFLGLRELSVQEQANHPCTVLGRGTFWQVRNHIKSAFWRTGISS